MVARRTTHMMLDDHFCTFHEVPSSLKAIFTGGVTRKVKMSHFARSKSEPLSHTVRLFSAKANDAFKGTVDASSCTQGSRIVVARDCTTLGRIPQYGYTLPGTCGCAAVEARAEVHKLEPFHDYILQRMEAPAPDWIPAPAESR